MNFFSRIAVVASVVAASLLSCTEAVAICRAGDINPCYTCTHQGSTCVAVGDPVPPGPRCNIGQVCINNNGVGTCGPAAGSPCACEPYTFGCDAYDQFAVTACYSDDFPPDNFEAQIIQMCPLDEPCSGGRCMAPTTTTTTTTTTTPIPTTTTKPATCTNANANTRYPFEGDCKKYYTCREVTRGLFRYVVSTCLGTTVFDAQRRFCDLPANVPGCP